MAMSRRRIILLAAVASLLAMVGVVVSGVGLFTRTDWGRERIRAFAEAQINRRIGGKIYIGRISGSLFSDLVVDSLELREKNDSLFLATGRIELAFDPRDLLEQRLVFSRVRASNVVVRIAEDSAGMLNLRRIFPPGPPGPPRTTRAWGDYIVVRQGVVESINVSLITRWRPPEDLPEAARDSVVAAALASTDLVVRRVGSGFQSERRWTNGRLELGESRIDDRDPEGRRFQIVRLDIDESNPPFRFRNASGAVQMAGDSLRANVTHFELPGSRGRMQGTVRWGGGPVRYDLTIEGDTVSLADVAWVYPTLPTEGGGRMNLVIRNQRDPRIIDYAILDMDVVSTGSRLRGDMTFGIGGPITVLKDVDLSAQPLDFRLVEVLSGAPLPVPWRGTITGTLRASGGPLNAFVVDEADLVFRDANVPGAVAVGRGRGTLDILEPAETRFRNFAVDLDQLDLRTLQFLSRDFPRLNGLVAGRATLDSSWLDVRFRDADVTHTDGSGPATRMIGAGRVTFGETVTDFDLALDASPLSFTTLARAYTEGRIPFKGEYHGPLRLQGNTSDLSLVTELRGPAGMIAYDGRIDGDSAGGYAANGTLRLTAVDLRTLLDTAVTAPTTLTGVADLDIAGDSLANLRGTALVELQRSFYDGVRIYEGTRARARFGDGRMRLDTLHVESVAGRLSAQGGLGTSTEVSDTLRFDLMVDSLGGLRRYLGEAAVSDSVAATDSLGGRIRATGRLFGSVQSPSLTAALDGRELAVAGSGARVLRANVALRDLRGAMSGDVQLSGDTIVASGVRLSNASADFLLHSDSTGEFAVQATAQNGPVIASAGGIHIAGDTTIVRFGSLGISLEDHRLSLADEATLRIEPSRMVLDTMRLRGGSGEEIVVAALLPDSAPMQALLRMEAMHLQDIRTMTQARVPFAGILAGHALVTGTRQAPLLAFDATITGASVGEVNVARVVVEGGYAERRLRASLKVLQGDTTVIDATANYPVDLAFAARERRVLDDTMRVTIRSRDVDLRLLESFTNTVDSSGGRFSANLDLAGPTGSRSLEGEMTVADGFAKLPDVGVLLQNVQLHVVAARDSVYVVRFSVRSGDESSDSLWLAPGSWIVHPLDTLNSRFNVDVGARDFHVIGMRQLADLNVSASILLRGSLLRSSAGGRVVVNSGTIYIPEFTARKQLFVIDEVVVDTALFTDIGLFRRAPSRLVAGMTVQDLDIVMGPDVWLRSDEADIKLAGSVNVTVSTPQGGTEPQLALIGELQTERGTYNLDLGLLVLRTFQIERGRLRFFGDPDFNPVLDINAVHTVRQISSTYGGRNDIRIGVEITGTLTNPGLRLVSRDSLPLSDSDMISYLVAGVPSFGIGGDFRGNTSTASAIFLNSISSIASSWATRATGGIFDYLQFQTAADRARLGAGFGFSNLFEGAQLGVGKQLNDQTFVAATSGLCQFQQIFQSSSSSAPSIFESLGLKIEHRFGHQDRYGASASIEPPFRNLVCTGTVTNAFGTGSRQWGFDFFRVWRW